MYAIHLTYSDPNSSIGDHNLIVSNPHDLFMITHILDSSVSVKSFTVRGINKYSNILAADSFGWDDVPNGKWRTSR